MPIKIEGRRINLRSITKADVPSLYEYARDEEISRYTFIPHPYKIKDALRFVRYAQAMARKKEEFHFGIELKGSKHIIGMIGVQGVNRKHKRGEVGYWVGKSFWGKGYAREALAMVLSFCFGELGMERAVAHVMHPNRASSRLLEKSGFTFEGKLRRHCLQHGEWVDILCYGILKEEFSSDKN